MPNQVVINDVTPRELFTSSPGQQIFNVLYTADATTDIDVYARASISVDPNDILQIVNPVDYTVTFVGVDQTVRVTFGVGRAAGEIITIARNTPPTRTNLYINTNFTPSQLNQDFGILTLIDQQAQMYDTVIAPHYNVSAVVTPADINTGEGQDIILPVLEANQVWAKNPANTEIIAYNVPAGGGIAPSGATYLIQTANPDLPNAQVMGALASGFVTNTTATGVQATRVFQDTASQIDIAFPDGVGGNPAWSLSSTLDTPGTFTIQGTVILDSIIDDDTFATATDTNIPTSESVKAYVDATAGGLVDSVTGTANQIIVDNTDPQNPILSAPQDIATTSTPIFAGFNDAANLAILRLVGRATAIDYFELYNGNAGAGPALNAAGSSADVSIGINTKGIGIISFGSAATTNQIAFATGTVLQHSTAFNFANTAATRTVTWPDADGTVAFVGSTVSTLTGTANQVLVNGTSATPTSGAITLTLPQSIATTSAVQFDNVRFNQAAMLLGSNGTIILAQNPVASAVNYFTMFNSSTGNPLTLYPSGTDTNRAVVFYAAGDAGIRIITEAVSVAPFSIVSGTSGVHGTSFIFANTSASRTVTFPDANFTITGTAAAMTNGQLPIGNTGNLPTAATLTAGTGVSITNGAGSITIAATGGGLAVATIAGTTETAVVNTKYFALNAAQTTLTLPVTSAVGDVVGLIGAGSNAGGWILDAPAGVQIVINGNSTSVGGLVASAALYGQTIYVECDVASTRWVMTSTVSTILTTF